MMNIVVWNSRGAGCTKFKDNVADLINIHRMESENYFSSEISWFSVL